MRVAIDCLAPNFAWGGLTTYTRNLAKHLAAKALDGQLDLYVGEALAEPLFAGENVRFVPWGAPPESPAMSQARPAWDRIGPVVLEQLGRAVGRGAC